MRNQDTRGIAWHNNLGRFNVNYYQTRRAQQLFFQGGCGQGNPTISGQPGSQFQPTPG